MKLTKITLAIALLLLLLISLVAFSQPAIAQPTASGTVCVLAYEDVNGNATRDPGEGLLSNVGVDLLLNNAIIANHITDGKEPFCFPNLPAQQYTINFSSPLYHPTTVTTSTFTLATGDSVTREFGAQTDVATQAAPLSSAGINIPATRGVRIGLAAGIAILAMLLFVGIGLIIYALFFHGRTRQKEKKKIETSRF